MSEIAVDRAVQSDVADLVCRPVKEWAEIVGLCERTLREELRSGRLGCARVGDRVLLNRRHIAEWLASREQPRKAA